MELESHHGIARMPHGHDFAVFGGRGDVQVGREAGARDHERVVATRLEWAGEAGEDAAAVVLDARGLPVHGTVRAHDPGAVGGSDALMPQADSQDWRRGTEAPDDVDRDARLRRGARAGRDDDVGRPPPGDLVERDRVVAMHLAFLPELAHVAREIENKGVVVVDEEDHGTRAATRPRALSRVSRYSSSGSESATMPPPAWK